MAAGAHRVGRRDLVLLPRRRRGVAAGRLPRPAPLAARQRQAGDQGARPERAQEQDLGGAGRRVPRLARGGCRADAQGRSRRRARGRSPSALHAYVHDERSRVASAKGGATRAATGARPARRRQRRSNVRRARA
eukprot:7381456-Prymnesium_polylepis.1